MAVVEKCWTFPTDPTWKGTGRCYLDRGHQGPHYNGTYSWSASSPKDEAVQGG